VLAPGNDGKDHGGSSLSDVASGRPGKAASFLVAMMAPACPNGASAPRILPLGLRQFGGQWIAKCRFPSSIGVCPPSAPASRNPRHSLRGEEYRPSRRRMAAVPPAGRDRSPPESAACPARSRPSARPIRQFGGRRRWGLPRRSVPASHRGSPSGAIQLHVFDWHNHVISVLRPEANSWTPMFHDRVHGRVWRERTSPRRGYARRPRSGCRAGLRCCRTLRG
jgi:hypothetical protein